MHLSRFSLLIALSAPLAALQPAWQMTPEPVPSAARSGPSPVQGRGLAPDQVLFDAPGDGSLWAVTARYKARFDHEGLLFVPFFGSHAPRNFPVRFTLESVRAGTDLVPLQAARGPVRDGSAVVLDRGSLVERYLVGTDGVEQTFQLKEAPGAGDLVVRVRVTSDLQPTLAGGGLSFANELGRVGYGAAFLVDAAGARTSLAQRLVDGCIEIQLPAALVADAVYPLTIDPVVAAFPVSLQPIHEHAPDIAFDALSNRYLLVWEQDFSGSDHDVYSVMVDAAGTPVPNSTQAIDATTIHWTRPRCAIVEGNVLTVATCGQAGFRQIRGRQLYVPQVGVIGSQFTIAVNRVREFENCNADVGGTTPQVGGGKWLVVYENSHAWIGRSVVGQLVQNQQPYGPSFTIDPYGDAHNPAVARSTGDAPQSTAGWPVVWQRYRTASDDDIWGAVVATDGSLLRSPFPVDTSARNDTDPSVSSLTDPIGGERMFAVAYTGEVTASDHDVLVRVLSVSGAVALGPTNVSALDARSQTQDQIQPHLDCDGCRFALAYSELAVATATRYDVWAWTLGVEYNQAIRVSEAKALVAGSSGTEIGVRVFAQHSAEPFQHRARYGIAYELAGGIMAAVYDGCAGGGYTVRPTGCAGLGVATGARPILGGTAEVFLQNVGLDSCVLMLGRPVPAVPLPCAPCALGVEAGSAVVFGGSYLRLDLPCDSAYVGLVFAVQGAGIGSSHPCAGGRVRFSDTVDVRIQ